MTDKILQTGDTVRLRSGGPEMTVGTVGSGPAAVPSLISIVECHWFQDDEQGGELRFAKFLPRQLSVETPYSEDEDGE